MKVIVLQLIRYVYCRGETIHRIYGALWFSGHQFGSRFFFSNFR